MLLAEENEALFKEIEEELRHDKASLLWRNYGKFIVLGAISLIVAVASYQMWQTYNVSKKMQRGEAFDATQNLSNADNEVHVISSLRDFSQNEDDGYSALAKFKEASILSKIDKNEAITLYRKLSNDNTINEHLRNLAVILGAFQQLETKSSPADLISEAIQLNQLTNPWRHSAREIIALNALQNGVSSKAASVLKIIINDSSTPKGIRTRSKEILSQIE